MFNHFLSSDTHTCPIFNVMVIIILIVFLVVISFTVQHFNKLLSIVIIWLPITTTTIIIMSSIVSSGSIRLGQDNHVCCCVSLETETQQSCNLFATLLINANRSLLKTTTAAHADFIVVNSQQCVQNKWKQ